MKKEENNYSEIIGYLKTKQEADEFVENVQLILNASFRTKGTTVEEFISAHFPHALARVLQKTVSTLSEKKDESQGLVAYFQGLIEAVGNLKVMHIVIAFNPTEKTLEKICTVVQDNFGEGILLDITCDRTLLAGAQITFDGKYKDYSLAKTFEKVFIDKREEIAKKIG